MHKYVNIYDEDYLKAFNTLELSDYGEYEMDELILL